MACQENVVKDETEGEQALWTHPYDTLVFLLHLSWAWVGPPRRAFGWVPHSLGDDLHFVYFSRERKRQPWSNMLKAAAAWCPDIIASTQSGSWRLAHLPGMGLGRGGGWGWGEECLRKNAGKVLSTIKRSMWLRHAVWPATAHSAWSKGRMMCLSPYTLTLAVTAQGQR